MRAHVVPLPDHAERHNKYSRLEGFRQCFVVRERLAALDERREEDETTTKEIDTFEREKSVFYAHSVESASYVHS